MSDFTHNTPPASQRLLLFGQFLTISGLLLFTSVLIYGLITAFTNGAVIDQEISDELLDKPFAGEFPLGLRLLSIVVLLLSSITGILGLYSSFRLFGDYRKGKVFTVKSGRRLRFIGWMVFLLGPVDMIFSALGVAIFSRWVDPSGLHVSFQVNDGHIFAAGFGLLIVIVAHVMVQAIALSEENRAIV